MLPSHSDFVPKKNELQEDAGVEIGTGPVEDLSSVPVKIDFMRVIILICAKMSL
jgi:hypothetical protein